VIETTSPSLADAPPRPPRVWPRAVLGVLLGLLLAALAGTTVLAFFGQAYAAAEFRPPPADPLPPALAKREARARARLDSVRPRGVYVVVDTFRNRMRIYRGSELLREAVVSTGSGVVLRDPRNGRQWVFDTPNGERTVQRKVKNPIWAKPDWAFVEEGYAPPPAGSAERFDDFSLGAYGLYMGDGYILHGTIFQSLLGRRVTHGCVRVGDADLEFLYKTVPVGAKVYIY
jgi:L,D-transpeptidase YbiS